MGLLQNINKYFRRSIPVATGSVASNYFKNPTFNPVRQYKGITFKAIDKIATSVSVYRPILMNAKNEAYKSHPVLELIKEPNEQLKNFSDFVYLMCVMYEIYGESFIYKVPGEQSGKTRQIILLDPSKVELNFYDGQLTGYTLHKNNGDRVPLLLEEVIHDKRPNPFNPWRGLSVLEKAVDYIETEITTTRFTLNYMKNNASPSGIVSLPNMAPSVFQEFTRKWRENYEGAENAGKTAFIRNGQADFKAVGATLKDIDAKLIRDMSKDDVLMMFDVPRPLLGMTDNKGFGRGNIDALEYIFYKDKINPIMERLDEVFEQVASEYKSGYNVTDVTHLSPIPEDKEFKHKQHRELVNVVLTVNEVRAELGLLPIIGGDVLAPENRPQQTNEKSAIKIKLVEPKKISKSDQIKKEIDDKEEFRQKLIKTNDYYAKKIKSAISKYAQHQQDVIIDKIGVKNKSFEEWLFNIKDESVELTALLSPLIIELMETQSADVANFITGELLTITNEIRQDVEARILKISGVYNQETITALEKTLTEGQTAGESLNKLSKRVESVYNDAQGYRAERIARTESLRASNSTAELVYRENGYSRIEWFVNPSACEFCQTYAGRTKEIGGTFTKVGDVITGANGNQLKIDYDDIDTPPLHPNCTCSIVPVV